ncbi:hypothetical protein N7495_004427 [Penicillium taxi]|uniref:uncharacterized protein n=1 Tax=Penicillium taxi TaxID=168475 RepID=UPI00254515A4|nr:uncharacterized protein N7495_004427 [Penicillium taxi]KAJ5899683.1 hypothetical protein N7495_004427 [Penicillium taxi]
MSTAEESPAQRAARQRRERREAKIREGGLARLDKISSLNGRTPLAAREDAPSPSPQPVAISPSPSPLPENLPSPFQPQQPADFPADFQAQQDAIRALLRQGMPGPDQDEQSPEMEDPTLKLLNSLLGAMPGDPNAPPPPPGAAGDMPAPALNPAAIASALGVPPFLANMLGGGAQPTEAEQRSLRIWKGLHIIFALGVAFYLVFIIGASVALFGNPPPKPSTVQNPFMIFVTGELLLTGGRVLLGAKQSGLGIAVKVFKDIVQDGSLVIFVLGLGSWYNGEWQGY